MWADFPPATAEGWKAAAERELKGRPLEKLSWTTPDGIRLEPIYFADTRSGARPTDQPALSLAIRQDFTLSQASRPPRMGTLAPELDWMGLQLQDREEWVWPEVPCSKILLSGSSVNLNRALRSGIQPGVVELDLWREFLAPAFLSTIPEPTRVWLSTASLQASGATPVQELGYGLASWVWQLRQLSERPAARLDWVLGVSSNLFTEVAKLRAARRLFSRVYESFGWPLEGHIQAVQSPLTWSILDPHTNLLRSTISAIAASCGGAASLRVEPFDAEGSELARRVASNQIRVLQLEGYLGAVQDPLAGSYFLEQYTDQLAQKAWALMQECEAEGGLALHRDAALEAVEHSRLELARRLATDRDCLVGVNRYAVADEKVAASASEAWRLASDFEELRGGAHLSAVLLVAGQPPRARVDFAARFLALGGITSREVGSLDEALASPTPLLVLCAPDEQYAALAAQARESIGAAPTRLGIAGSPQLGGADFYLHLGANRIDTLKQIRAKP